jgi:hypothetical protein
MIKALIDPDQFVSILMLYVVGNFVPGRGIGCHNFFAPGSWRKAAAEA